MSTEVGGKLIPGFSVEAIFLLNLGVLMSFESLSSGFRLVVLIGPHFSFLISSQSQNVSSGDSALASVGRPAGVKKVDGSVVVPSVPC